MPNAHTCHYCYGSGCQCPSLTHYYLGRGPILNGQCQPCHKCKGSGECWLNVEKGDCNA